MEKSDVSCRNRNNNSNSKSASRWHLVIGIMAVILMTGGGHHFPPQPLVDVVWLMAQGPYPEEWRTVLQQWAWNHWKVDDTHSNTTPTSCQPIPVVQGRVNASTARALLGSSSTNDWIRRPLLLRHVWTPTSLTTTKNRSLTLQGLSTLNNLSIPYFYDARQAGLWTPDRVGTVADILRNLTSASCQSTDSDDDSSSSSGCYHKIASQFILQNHPEWIEEIVPGSWATELFGGGDYFSPRHVVRTGWWSHFLPPLTTVPLFISRLLPSSNNNSSNNNNNNNNTIPHTGLHAEPIASIAVQLSGTKVWTLYNASQSRFLRPTSSPDGRAFVRSVSDGGGASRAIPYCPVTTTPGDALWVPPWTWHRVDYSHDHDNNNVDLLSMAASVFHFRPALFWSQQPLFAILVLPSLFRELMGWHTQ